MSNLEHKNVVKLYYAFENESYYFIVMELMKGGTLERFIKHRYSDSSNNFFMTDSECSEIMKGLLKGVDYLHSYDITHRDLKPENVMFEIPNDLTSIKIGDFGISNINEYRSTQYCGTYIYMSPEEIKRKPYTDSVDTWALGIIMYIMGSGGAHPIYRANMTKKEYEDKINKLEVEGWNFNDEFPMYIQTGLII